jgi:hypothetical protein
VARERLLSQFRERRFDSREYRGLSELREDSLRVGQMLKRKRTLFLDLVKYAQNHMAVARMSLKVRSSYQIAR